jgi:hypothetical protein
MGRMLCTGLGCLAFSIGLGALGVVCLGTGGSGADDDGGGCQADSVLLLFFSTVLLLLSVWLLLAECCGEDKWIFAPVRRPLFAGIGSLLFGALALVLGLTCAGDGLLGVGDCGGNGVVLFTFGIFGMLGGAAFVLASFSERFRAAWQGPGALLLGLYSIVLLAEAVLLDDVNVVALLIIGLLVGAFAAVVWCTHWSRTQPFCGEGL